MLSPIGLGCWQFVNNNRWWNQLSQKEVDKIVKISLNNGINWFDTAEAYYGSERILASALNKVDNEFAIATKWLPTFRTARNIARTINKRLSELAPHKISLYQIHYPYAFSTIERLMESMVYLVRDNKIKYIGVSNFNAKQVRQAYQTLNKYGLVLASNQVKYNLYNRSIESNGVYETCKELGVSIIAYSPLAQGLLTGKYHRFPSLIKDLPFARRLVLNSQINKTDNLINCMKVISLEHNCSISEIALSWLINRGVFVLVGISNVSQIYQNVKAMNLELTPMEITEIERVK
jgi:aryl-alcohol dehydrogenase-like predicted oxidoreductase